METVFLWLYLFAAGCTVIFSCLMVQDFWRQRRRKYDSSVKSLQVKPRMPGLRGYDYPELFVEDTEIRLGFNEQPKEAKTEA